MAGWIIGNLEWTNERADWLGANGRIGWGQTGGLAGGKRADWLGANGRPRTVARFAHFAHFPVLPFCPF